MKHELESLPITKPVLGQRERELMLRPLDTGWLVQGPYVQEFETLFQQFSGADHALAVSSCTTGLHLILHALGIGPGDEVVVPSFTYIASANAVEYTGATPVLCDIDLATFNIDVADASRKVTSRTKAIMPVSLFGLSADMAAVNKLASEHGISVIEDAACAMGATYDGVHAGLDATAAAFSFHPRKAITTGEGGMVVCSDDELADRMTKLRNHGAESSDLERSLSQGGSLLPAFNLLGFNYRLTDIQGALGMAQMERAADVIAQRRAAAAVYDELLAGNPLVCPPFVPGNCVHAYQSYTTLFGVLPGQPLRPDELGAVNLRRNKLMHAMEGQGIQVRQGTHAVHTLGYYASKYGYDLWDLPNSFIADRLSLTLPLFAGITRQQQERVVACFCDES